MTFGLSANKYAENTIKIAMEYEQRTFNINPVYIFG